MRRMIGRLVVTMVVLHLALAPAVSDDEAGMDFGIPRLDEVDNVTVVVTGTPEVMKKKKFDTASANVSSALVEKLDAAGVFETASADAPAGASATD